ncbi:MAG: XdhC family protein [Bacillota bacterium]
MNIYKIISELLSSGKKVALITVISSDYDPSFKGNKVVVSEDRVIYSELDEGLTESIYARAEPHVRKAQSVITGFNADQKQSGQIFIQIFQPSPRIIILGGGHVGAALCRMAAQLDYEIIVIDDRPSFASESIHPDADQLICEQFDRAFDQIEPSPTDYIVIVTRGHRHDRLCLEKALERDSAYIGMIGSRKRVSEQIKSMAESGYSRDHLARIHSPIGLSIGAVTEAEIALSILAEITAVRRSGCSDEAFQDEVLRELAQLEEDGRKAVLATIVNVQGSTPRKTGSQMIIFPDGTQKGTIGGGCAEAEVRREALLCFDHAREYLFKLKLTADAAAEEGMACGGIMDLYLELLPHNSPKAHF